MPYRQTRGFRARFIFIFTVSDVRTTYSLHVLLLSAVARNVLAVISAVGHC